MDSLIDKHDTDVPPPGYVSKRPRYPAAKMLNLMSGMQDTLINLAELSIRNFEKTMAATEDANAFVKDACREFGINSSLGVSWDDVRTNAHRAAVVQALSVADSFVRQLTREYRLFRGILNDPWKTQKDGEQFDPLTGLTENLPTGEKRRARECPEYDLWHYFRLVRNRIIHQSETDTDKHRKSLVAKHRSHFTRCYNVLPNTFKDIGYDDFLLFTRATKYYAKVLNDACDLRVNDIVVQSLSDTDFLAQVRRAKGSPGKMAHVAKMVAAEYVLNKTQTDEVLNAFQSFAASDPPRKVRRKLNE